MFTKSGRFLTQVPVSGCQQSGDQVFSTGSTEERDKRGNDEFREVEELFLRKPPGRNRPNQEILLSDWLLTSHVTYITRYDWLFTKSCPQDLQVLRHDKVAKPREVKEHLATVPEYLIPAGLKGNIKQQSSHKKHKALDLSRKRIGNYKGQASKRKNDPLKSFKYKKAKEDN